MNIMITGGAGFIGKHLVQLCLSKGARVTAIDNLLTGSYLNIAPYVQDDRFRFYQKDILKLAELPHLLAKTDVIFHLAATVGMFNVIEHPLQTITNNIATTQYLLEAVAKSGNKPILLIASSSEVYGSANHPMKEEDDLVLASTARLHASYPISKLCNEVEALAYHKAFNIPVVIARLFNCVGEGQSGRYGMVLPRFVNQALAHESLTVYGDGSQTRSFCDVRDTSEMLYRLAMTSKAVGEIVNVGSDEEISIQELAKKIIRLAKSHATLTFQSFDAAYGNEYLNIMHRCPNLDKMQGLIDYTRQYTLDDTIKSMVLKGAS